MPRYQGERMRAVQNILLTRDPAVEAKRLSREIRMQVVASVVCGVATAALFAVVLSVSNGLLIVSHPLLMTVTALILAGQAKEYTTLFWQKALHFGELANIEEKISKVPANSYLRSRIRYYSKELQSLKTAFNKDPYLNWNLYERTYLQMALQKALCVKIVQSPQIIPTHINQLGQFHFKDYVQRHSPIHPDIYFTTPGGLSLSLKEVQKSEQEGRLGELVDRILAHQENNGVLLPAGDLDDPAAPNLNVIFEPDAELPA